MNNDRYKRSAIFRNGLCLQSPARRELLRLAGAAGIGIVAPNLLLGCSDSTGVSSPTFEATIAAARNAMLAATADPALPSISAALVDGERVIWAEAFGKTDAAGSAPTTDTMFAIGSVSKMFATIATMILVDRQLVDLDAPLVSYVKDFRMASPEYAQITVRMLLSHSSGFPGTEARDFATMVPFPGYLDNLRQAMVNLRLKHAPGEMAVYCNDGFTMIEALVAAMSGKSFTQFVQEEIFTPLAMTHSRYPLAAFAPGSYAPGFTDNAPDPMMYVNLPGAGSLWSTPSDIGRVAMMLINGGQIGGGRILSQHAIAEMGRDHSGGLALNPVTQTIRFGLGWDDVAYNGLAETGITAWKKSGAVGAYHSVFIVAPTARLAFFVVAAGPEKYAGAEIAERILLQALAERGSIASVPAPLPTRPLPEASPTDAQLAAIAGYYANYKSVMRVVAQPDRTLTLSQFVNGAWKDTDDAARLKMRSDGTFSSDAKPLMAYRAAESGGLRYLVQREAYGAGHYLIEWPYGQRIEPKAAVSAAWAARVGKRWLAVNEDVQSSSWSGGGVVFELAAVPELPGYVLNGPQITDATGSDTLAAMCLKIPVLDGRDLNDIVIEKHNAEEWVRISSTWCRPVATVPALGAGTSTIVIGSETYAEWRKLPASGTVSVTGATAWKLFDSDFALKASSDANGSAPLPGTGDAAYLLLFGAAGAAISVSMA